MKNEALLVESLTAGYNHKPIIKNVSFSAKTSSVLGVIGPNGAGKSTLLKAILGLNPNAAGRVTFFGQPLEKVRKKVTYVPQSLSLDLTFPVTVLDVVLMGTYPHLGWIKKPGKKQKQIALNALEKVGLQDFKKNQIGDLSGGQRQRVFLARALAQDPQLLIMDEPFAGVDVKSEKNIVDVLHDLRDAGASIIMVHHDLSTVTKYCDRVALLNKKLFAVGDSQTTFTPENLEKVYGFPAGQTGAKK